MRTPIIAVISAVLGMEGCSNGARSADPSAFYYTWRDDSGAAEVVYAVTTRDGVNAVREWIKAHAVELKRVEEFGPMSWMPLDFLFEAYPDGSRREHVLTGISHLLQIDLMASSRAYAQYGRPRFGSSYSVSLDESIY